MLSCLPASSSVGVHAMRAPCLAMTTSTTPKGVESWYDSGVRLTGGMVVPTEPTADPVPTESAPSPRAAAVPANDAPAGIVGARPAYVWNPTGLTVDGLPSELQPFKDQFVPEFVVGVPSYLDGKTYQGDVGFDPWALVALADPKPDRLQALVWAKDRKAHLEAMPPEERAASLKWMREAELKHARLAMLAAAGWPLGELLNPLAATGGRAPSLFNGQLIENGVPVAAVLAGLAFLEVQTQGSSAGASRKVIPYGESQAGDYGFDPLREYTQYFPARDMQLAEIKHGRAAMMGITGFAVQEALWGSPVVEQTPFFFGH